MNSNKSNGPQIFVLILYLLMQATKRKQPPRNHNQLIPAPAPDQKADTQRKPQLLLLPPLQVPLPPPPHLLLLLSPPVKQLQAPQQVT